MVYTWVHSHSGCSTTLGSWTGTGNRSQSRRWAVGEQAKLHLNSQSLLFAQITAWAPPPNGSVGAGDSQEHTPPCELHVWGIWVALLNRIILKPSPTSVDGKIFFHKTGPWCQKGWTPRCNTDIVGKDFKANELWYTMFSSIIVMFELKWKCCYIKYNHVGHGSYAEEKKFNFEIKILGKVTGKRSLLFLGKQS